MRRVKRFHRPRAERKENSMASMIDVVFLLLIFFLVVNKPIDPKTLFDTSLPAGKEGKPAQAPFIIDVTRLKGDPVNEWYTVKGRPWRLENLKPILSRMAENDPEASLIINCGPNARHVKLIHLLDACSDVGLRKFNLVNDQGIPFVDGAATK